MSIQLDREITQDFERATGIEWLEPNGLGGWAGTTVAGAHSRRHHGLLVAATGPERRSVLLSRLDETLHVEGASFELGCNRFPGAVAPRGFEYLASFRKDLFPVFEYEMGGVRLRKTVATVAGENTTLVLYEVLEAPGPFVLSLRPFVAARDQHALTSANDVLSQEMAFSEGVLRLAPYAEEPAVFVAVPGGDFQGNPQWWYRFEYEQDRRRGFDYQEDLWTPGLFSREMAAGSRLGVVIATDDPRGRDAFALFEKERERRVQVLASLPDQKEPRDGGNVLEPEAAYHQGMIWSWLPDADALVPVQAKAAKAAKPVKAKAVKAAKPVRAKARKEQPVKAEPAVKPVAKPKRVAEAKPKKAPAAAPGTAKRARKGQDVAE